MPDSRCSRSRKNKEELDQHISACLVEMTKRAMPFFNQFLHITEIKGISFLSAILIISEIGVDMTVWESTRQLCSWAGRTPGNNESANKKKSTRITKAGQYLKPCLFNVHSHLSKIKTVTLESNTIESENAEDIREQLLRLPA